MKIHFCTFPKMLFSRLDVLKCETFSPICLLIMLVVLNRTYMLWRCFEDYFKYSPDERAKLRHHVNNKENYCNSSSKSVWKSLVFSLNEHIQRNITVRGQLCQPFPVNMLETVRCWRNEDDLMELLDDVSVWIPCRPNRGCVLCISNW